MQFFFFPPKKSLQKLNFLVYFLEQMEKITPEILKEARKRQGLTQKQFAELLCIGETAYNLLEKGRRPISRQVKRLAELTLFCGIDRHKIEYTHEEWQQIEGAANREGFSNPEKWIASKIKAYLAMLNSNNSLNFNPVKPNDKKRKKTA